eukprot:CAMPEP_0201713562 /NCGR_PEP_ID=MMETSP0593-20130828/357_1 /ASSEMBLY_ACC=CAM_ASM_000672 /TAXON_ID=267983 /ORGANISM="Skeletonema japonicum, Strain CCMP2506" /LENGTH=148 /DNA_ID=CAMNT_0048202725 /DNA_START=94 /DNA_END=540 /DNA_ORIENTATION=-
MTAEAISKQQVDGGSQNQNKPENNDATTAAAPIKPASSTTTKKNNNQKIKVHLVAVGSAPILKKNKFLMNRTDNFGVAISFLRKRLKLGTSTNANTATSSTASSASSLFLYVNSAFVPCPTEQIGDLYDCFGMREELVIHYSLQEAWG